MNPKVQGRSGLIILLGAVLATGAFVVSAFAAGPPAKAVALFILAGQSNMSGRGLLTDLPSEFLKPHPQVWLYDNSGRWRSALEPVDDPAGQVDQVSADPSAGVSPGLAFGRALVDLCPGLTVGLIPCAKGGSDLESWRPRRERQSLYGSCLTRAKEAQVYGRIAGLIWYQGESDAATTATAAGWTAKFEAFLNNLRADLGSPRLPAVVTLLGDLGSGRKGAPEFAHWDEVRAAQAQVKSPAVHFVSAQGLPLKDGLHLTTAGAVALGRAYARTMSEDVCAGQRDIIDDHRK